LGTKIGCSPEALICQVVLQTKTNRLHLTNPLSCALPLERIKTFLRIPADGLESTIKLELTAALIPVGVIAMECALVIGTPTSLNGRERKRTTLRREGGAVKGKEVAGGGWQCDRDHTVTTVSSWIFSTDPPARCLRVGEWCGRRQSIMALDVEDPWNITGWS
jgi:hypothetical protein